MPNVGGGNQRLDLCTQFGFRVKWDGKYIPGILRMSGLRRRTEVLELRESGGPASPQKLPGTTACEAVVLERGRTDDAAFEEWAGQLTDADGVGSEGFKKDVVIELHNEAGHTVMSFTLHDCWPSEYVALEEIDAHATCVPLESITLECDGWTRHSGAEELA